MDFGILVLAAFVGLCVRAIWGFNPIAIAGAISFAILILPAVQIAGQNDTEVAQSMVNVYISNVTEAFPSIIIGELAGMLAKEIYSVFAGVVSAFQR